MTAPTLIFDLEGPRLLAVEARLAGGKVRVTRTVRAERSGEFAGEDDPQRVGAWIRGILDEHGFKAKIAIVSVSRGEALIKTLDAPGEDLSPGERHEMVRLQMTRKASLTSADTVIDYIEHDAAPDGVPGVIAAAMPAPRVQWRRDVVKAAGLRLAGIRLRSAGIRAMVSQADTEVTPALVLAPGLGTLELVVIDSGRLVFSRSIDTPLPSDADPGTRHDFAERVSVEASRTWVSYRVSPGGEDIERVVVLGAEPLAGAVAEAVGERLELPSRIFTPGDLLDADEAIDPDALSAAIPLAGLLACRSQKVPVLDFANPTKPPDTSATVRQAVLAAALFLIILAGAGYLFAQKSLDEKKAMVAVLEEEAEKAGQRYARAQLDGARLGHMRAWTADETDWFAHLAYVIEQMPDPTAAALGELSVELDRRVVFEGESLTDQAAWSARTLAGIRLAGAVVEREHAQAYRQRLLDAGVYRVVSQGPEVDNRFSLEVTTASPEPPGAVAAGGPASGERGADE